MSADDADYPDDTAGMRRCFGKHYSADEMDAFIEQMRATFLKDSARMFRDGFDTAVTLIERRATRAHAEGRIDDALVLYAAVVYLHNCQQAEKDGK